MLNKWKKRGFLGVLAAVLVLAVAPIASAHHATVSASLDCNGVITYTVQSWEGHTSDNGGVNTNVYLQDSLGNTFPVPHGAFNDADNYQFSGTFTIPTNVTSDTLTPVTGTWGDGESGGTYSQYAVDRHASQLQDDADSVVDCVGPRDGRRRDSRYRARVGLQRDSDGDGHVPGVRAG